jgi:Tfp pilus assembly protein PilF
MDSLGWSAGDLIQLAITAVIFFVVVPLRGAIQELKESDDKLRAEFVRSYEKVESRVSNLEVELARNYVQRGEVTHALDEIRTALLRIESGLQFKIERLDENKADKTQ